MKPINERPSKNEAEYFAKYDADLVTQLRDQQDRARQAAERLQHRMKCPRCGADLREVRYSGAIVDVCPECKGMWLDAGEAQIIAHTFQAETTKRSFVDDLAALFTTTKKK